jgi:hypothetical protein
MGRAVKPVKPLPPAPVDKPASFDVADVAALQAVYHGRASEDQQRRAMQWVIKGAANVQGVSFRPGDSHASAFMEGRRFVAVQILALIELSTEELKKRTTTDGN